MQRELVEELGYECDRLVPISAFYVSPGGSSERVFLYYAEVDASDRAGDGGGVPAEGEAIESWPWASTSCSRWSGTEPSRTPRRSSAPSGSNAAPSAEERRPQPAEHRPASRRRARSRRTRFRTVRRWISTAEAVEVRMVKMPVSRRPAPPPSRPGPRRPRRRSVRRAPVVAEPADVGLAERPLPGERLPGHAPRPVIVPLDLAHLRESQRLPGRAVEADHRADATGPGARRAGSCRA